MADEALYKEIPLTQGKVTIVDTADFDWLNQWKWRFIASGHIGYAARSVSDGRKPNGKQKQISIPIHRLIMNAPKELEVDHINGNPLDNRRSNLRLCTTQQNSHNRGKNIIKTSIYKGVSWNKTNKRWSAIIFVNKKNIYLGGFKKEEDAALAYNEAAKQYFGEFARLNIITK